MKRRVRLLFICLWWVLLGHISYGQSFQQAESWLFSFPEGKDLLLADYGENVRELQKMDKSLRGGRVALLEGTEHLLIISHIASYASTETVAINEASLRASRLRAYIKQKLHLPHECVAFYIDRSGKNENQVHVYRVPSALPWFVNQEICYSESHYAKSMDEAVAQYGAIPFVEMYKRTSGDQLERVIYRISDALFEREELDDYLLQTGNQTDTSTTPDSVGIEKVQRTVVRHTASEKVVTPPPHTAMPESKSSVPAGHKTNSLFNLAIKTNLLPWCSLAPSVMIGNGPVQFQQGSFMPNLELEYYFARRWSVAVSGLYAYYTYGHNPGNLWGVSHLTLEPRIWLLPDNRFRWAWIGAFGQYGDFDVQGDKISADGLYGRTGQYASGGLSVGCLVPVAAGFCIEAVVQGGYRSVFGAEKYRYDEVDQKNYRESLFSSTGMMLGFRLNLIYRFGIN